jgi:hypothetical protein
VFQFTLGQIWANTGIILTIYSGATLWDNVGVGPFWDNVGSTLGNCARRWGNFGTTLGKRSCATIHLQRPSGQPSRAMRPVKYMPAVYHFTICHSCCCCSRHHKAEDRAAVNEYVESMIAVNTYAKLENGVVFSQFLWQLELMNFAAIVLQSKSEVLQICVRGS